MLQFIDLKHQFGPTVLFEGFSWHIKPNSKIGLIGPNGAGKTTLFRFANGEQQPDSGSIVCSKNTSISLFQQIPDFSPQESVIDTILHSIPDYKEYVKQKGEISQKLEELSHDAPEFAGLLEKQAALEEAAHVNGLHTLELEAKKFLSGLGFQEDDFLQQISHFSPGFHHRMALAIALLTPHNLLLLDEPTNHLDDKSKQWLVEFLQGTKKSFILVTHDPEFLNQTTETIAEISMQGIMEFRGSLEDFLEEKNEIHAKLQMQYAKEEAFLKKRLEWIERFRAKATKARQVQSAVKKLEKRETVTAPTDSFWNKEADYKFHFQNSGKVILRLEDSGFAYPGEESLFSKVNLELSPGDKVAVVGKNGAGKSTLMRCIYGKQGFTEGNMYVGPKTLISYFNQTHSEVLQDQFSIYETVQQVYPDSSEGELRSLLGHFSFSGDQVFKSVSAMSGGEKSRLRLALLVPQPSNCLLLDEPTNHLDMVTRNALQSALLDYPGCVLVISHDPEFLKDLCNKTFRVANGTLEDLNCEFADYLKYHQEYQEKPQAKPQTKSSGGDGRSSQNQDKKRKKKLQKQIDSIEQKIEDLELQKESLEAKISSASFYQEAGQEETLQEYEAVKAQIEEQLLAWENHSHELDELAVS